MKLDEFLKEVELSDDVLEEYGIGEEEKTLLEQLSKLWKKLCNTHTETEEIKKETILKAEEKKEQKLTKKKEKPNKEKK